MGLNLKNPTQKASVDDFVINGKTTITQTANAESLIITSSATTYPVIDIDTINTDGNVFSFSNTGNHTDAGNYLFLLDQANGSAVVSNMLLRNTGAGNNVKIHSTSGSAGEVLFVHQDNVSATANAVDITNDGTGEALNIVSTTSGVLFPRMTTAQKNAIGSPAEGLMVYDLTLSKICVYTGAAWETITSV